MQNPDMWKRITNGVRVNGFMSIVEQKFADMCNNAGITYKYDEWINQKHWDFTIYCENRLDFIIEIDGEWCHGLVGDSDGKHQVREQKNIERLAKVPDGVKYLCTNSNNIKNAFQYILQYIGCDINVWIDAIYNTLPEEFPYPVYADYRLRKDYQRLMECPSYKGSELGMCAIYHFHKSLYSHHRDNMISPVNLWTDKDKMLTCINSRELYNSPFSSINIVSYLYLSNTARLYSVTSPGMIKYLINKYVHDAYSIIDPFALTGNILLGCACLRKSYVGRAMTDTILAELMMIDQYYQCNSQLYTCSDFPHTRYDALVTCIPLDSDADRYIDWCIQHIRCSTYMFLTRDIRKYERYVIDISYKYGDNDHLILIHASDT